MRSKLGLFTSMALLAAAVLSACRAPMGIEPTATLSPIPTQTQTVLPASTPTATPASLPVETAVPQPTSLRGTVLLFDDSVRPFASWVELRQKDSFALVGRGQTDASGMYSIVDIEADSYELWILITAQAAMIPGCADVAPPDDSWQIGIKFAEDKALSMENAYLSKALLLAENLQSSDLTPQGFFAVLQGFEIVAGLENAMDVTLNCR